MEHLNVFQSVQLVNILIPVIIDVNVVINQLMLVEVVRLAAVL